MCAHVIKRTTQKPKSVYANVMKFIRKCGQHMPVIIDKNIQPAFFFCKFLSIMKSEPTEFNRKRNIHTHTHIHAHRRQQSKMSIILILLQTLLSYQNLRINEFFVFMDNMKPTLAHVVFFLLISDSFYI